MNVIKGDLIELLLNGEFNVIVHGCNCFCTMGAGIAKQIKKRFPRVYESDLQTIRGDKNKLGNIRIIKYKNFDIINAYTQYNYINITNRINVDYDAIRSCFKQIKKFYSKYNNIKIGYPLIGCGLAGGNWNIVRKIINEELKGMNHSLVEYKK